MTELKNSQFSVKKIKKQGNLRKIDVSLSIENSEEN
jgi:hypothetical protein